MSVYTNRSTSALTSGSGATLSATKASAASATWGALAVLASTLTWTGSTNVTTATGVNLVQFAAPTLTSGSALTVTNAATLYIGGAPIAAGSTTITNSYALWVDSGKTRLDGDTQLGASSQYDATNKRLGIGRTDPQVDLEVYSTTTSVGIKVNANVSGTANAALELISTTGNLSMGYVYFYNQVAGSEWTLGTRIVSGSLTRLELGFGGNTPNTCTNVLSLSQSNVASAASTVLDRILFAATTSTFTGTTQITTAAGVNYLTINRPTYTDASALTIDRGATVYIENAPLAAGSVTLTTPYALFVDAGLVRVDGNGTHVFELPADATDPTAGGGAAAGRVAASIGGATRYIAYY